MNRTRQTVPATAVLMALVTVLSLLSCNAIGAVSIEKVADTATPLPGGMGYATKFPEYAAVDGRAVVFWAESQVSKQAIYSNLGGQLRVVASTTTPVPGGGGNFGGFSDSVSIAGNTIAFVGVGPGDKQGVYTSSAGQISTVADTVTLLGGNVRSFAGVTLDEAGVAFRGVLYDNERLFTSVGGVIYSLKDGRFAGPPCFDNHFVAFTESRVAVWRCNEDGGSLAAVADTGSTIPHGAGNFTGFGHASCDGGSVAFLGWGNNNQKGVYAGQAGSLLRIADTTTPIPEGSGNFVDFLDPSMDEGNLVFWGASQDRTGIYAYIDGQLLKVLDSTDPLDGKAISRLRFYGLEGFDEGCLVFKAEFTDGSSGVFTAVIPEPATISLLAVAGLLVIRRHCARRLS